MTKSRKKSKQERLRAAAVVKVKYELTAGRLDSGFEFVFKGVLQDLGLTEPEVDEYIEQNREALTEKCMQAS
jgi:hypothetical protein